MRLPLFEAARPYLERHWPIFPVARNKVPLTEHGRDDATTSGEQVKLWQDKFPNANIAIATGKESRLVVIDIDGETGLESFKLLKERFAIPTDGPIARSANGWHLYFYDPSGNCPTSQGRLGRHIDVRGVGGSITAPPSIHETGVEYRWLRQLGITLPKLPLALYPLLYDPRVIIHRNVIRKCEDIENLVYVVRDAPKGERNATLNRASFIAGKMIAEGKIDYQSAYQALYEAAIAAGLERRETDKTIRSGLRAGSGGMQ